jgi:hypothetical protein
MKVLYFCAVLSGSLFLLNSPSAHAQGVLSPVEVVRNANLDKAIAKSVRTKDPSYTYANEQDGRYKVLRAKSVEIWFSPYSKSVEVYKYTLQVGLAGAKKALTRIGADFSQGNFAYMSNGDPTSKCYAIQLEALSATSTRVSYSYECD